LGNILPSPSPLSTAATAILFNTYHLYGDFRLAISLIILSSLSYIFLSLCFSFLFSTQFKFKKKYKDKKITKGRIKGESVLCGPLSAENFIISTSEGTAVLSL
jgi:hypothetical protein